MAALTLTECSASLSTELIVQSSFVEKRATDGRNYGPRFGYKRRVALIEVPIGYRPQHIDTRNKRIKVWKTWENLDYRGPFAKAVTEAYWMAKAGLFYCHLHLKPLAAHEGKKARRGTRNGKTLKRQSREAAESGDVRSGREENL